MELIESEKNQTGALPQPEPRLRTASLPAKKSQLGQAWLRIILGIVAAIILIVLIVLFARWVYHKTHHKATPAPAASQQTPAEQSGKTPAAASRPPGGSSSTPPASTNTPSTPSTTQITNTGPGNVAVIFVGASLLAGGLHYIISLRRFNKTGA